MNAKLTVGFLFAMTVCGTLSAANVVVTPDNMGTWAFDVTDDNGAHDPTFGSASMVYGPGTPPLGLGSANLQTAPGMGNGAALITDTELDGVLVSSLTTLTYSTYVTTNNGQQFPYLALKVNEGSVGGGVDDTFFFEPTYSDVANQGVSPCASQAAEVLGTWQTWDALNGCWWNNNGNANQGNGAGGVTTLAALLAIYPDAMIVLNASNGDGGLSLRMGYASAGDNYNGNVDNVTINSTTYDFEATPEPGSIALFGLGLTFFGWLRHRKKA